MDIAGIHFADPAWLLGLGALPLAALVFYLFSKAGHRTLTLGNPLLVGELSSFLTPQAIPPFLRLLVLGLCLTAAARPQSGERKVEEKRPVTDLFVTLDVSSSMIMTDLKPNRITAAKRILADFLDKVRDARIGLTIFTSISFTQCPLTTDTGLLKKLLDNVELSSIHQDGTAIGDALVSSLNRLKKGTGRKNGGEAGEKPSLLGKWFGAKEGEAPPEGAGNDKAIILLTDGSDNASHIHPLAAAKLAVAEGVKIYAIGMGTQKRVPALGRYPDGHLAPYIDERTGRIALTDPVDMGLLREMARLTGGTAYAATDNGSLQAVLGEIAKMEKRDLSVSSHWDYHELASFFLLAAFLVLALDILLEATVLRTLP